MDIDAAMRRRDEIMRAVAALDRQEDALQKQLQRDLQPIHQRKNELMREWVDLLAEATRRDTP